MSETETTLDVSNIAADPSLAGGLLGVGPGAVERLLVHVRLTTLAVGLAVAAGGLVLAVLALNLLDLLAGVQARYTAALLGVDAEVTR